MWKILQRNRKWVAGCTITESINLETEERRFSATIDGWRNWRLLIIAPSYDGENVVAAVKGKVIDIQERIRSGDRDVFGIRQAW